jgi:hypothetical protein
MKKIQLSLLLIAATMCTKLSAQADIWANGITVTVNKTPVNYGFGSNAGSVGTVAPGTLTNVTSFVLNGGTILTNKSSNSNVCDGLLVYEIDSIDGKKISADTIKLDGNNGGFEEDCESNYTFQKGAATGSACNPNNGDQQWSNITNSIDLTSTLSTGNYTLKLTFLITGSNTSSSDCSDTLYGNGEGANSYEINFDFTALPITLISFTATSQSGLNLLLWQTGVEANSKGFEVEGSTDGINFQDIAFVAAKGSNSTYSYTDGPTNKFYKLKMLDLDGSFKESDIVSVQTSQSSALKVYPNPADNTINVIGNGTVNIYDVSGKLMMSAATKDGYVQIDISKLPQGLYFVSTGKDAVEVVKK